MVRSPPLTVVLSSGKLMLAASSVATKLTVSVSPPPPPPPQGSGMTMADELFSYGGETWLSWLVVPSLNWQAVQYVLSDWGTCPRWASKAQTGPDDYQVDGGSSSGGPAPQTLVEHPVAGARSLTVGSGYVPVNCTPGIAPGLAVSHQYSAPAFRFDVPSAFQLPWAVAPIRIISTFGNATFTYQGKTYQAIGTCDRVTYVSAHDPSPGYYLQAGWIYNQLFILQFYILGTPPNQFFQGWIWWNDTKQMESIQSVIAVAGTCPNFTYTVNTSRGVDTITVSIARFGTGQCGAGFGFGPSTSKLGGQGVAMTNTGR